MYLFYRFGTGGGGPDGGLLGNAGGAPLAAGGRGGGALLFGGGGNSLLGVDAAEESGVPPMLLSLFSETGVEPCRGGNDGLDLVGGIGGAPIFVSLVSLSLLLS